MPQPVSGNHAVRLLIVEDDAKIATALAEGLAAERYLPQLEHTGEGAFFRATTEPFDAVLLDVSLPGRSGLDVLTALRSQGRRIPVLMLTARDGVEDRVRGLDAGADDYVVKPFAFAELVARLRALLRRGIVEATQLQAADVAVDRVTRAATRAGRDLGLTAMEFDVLACLLRHPDQPVSRETLTRDVWNEAERSGALDNVIDVHVGRLRKKVDAGATVKRILTVRGLGFMFSTDADAGRAND